MPPKQIPGFYFDEEKNRYFRIQADHNAPLGSKHSKTHVAKEEETQRKRKWHEIRSAKVRRERIRRPEFLRSTLPGCLLEQQYGLKNTHSIPKSPESVFLQGISSYESDNIAAGGRNQNEAIKDLVCFAMNDGTSSAFLAKGSCLGRFCVRKPGLEWRSDERLSKKALKKIDTVNNFHNTIASVSICPSSGALIAITDPGSHNTSFVNIDKAIFDEQRDDQFGHYWPATRYGFHDATIWKAATYQSNSELCSLNSSRIGQGSPSTIAVATSRGPCTLVPDQTGYRLSSNILPHSLEGDIINLTWTSRDVIALGYRRGYVCFFDVRTDTSAGNIGLKHPGFIAGMELADDPNRLVVSGFSSPLCLYDVRMSRRSKGSGQSGRRGKSKYYRSTPVVQFKDYANTLSTKIGLAVHGELGLVASGTNDGNTMVSSLRTGETLRIFNNPDFNHSVETLRFCENDNVPELWAATGNCITKYAWKP